jgi:hypothetical protein
MGLRKLGGFEQLPSLDLTKDGEGQKTTFKLLASKAVQSKFNADKMSNVYTVEVKGEKMQFWGDTVLDARLAEAELGSTLTVVYLGKTPSKDRGKQPFKNYDIFVDDPEYNGDDSVAEGETVKAAKKTAPF